MPKRPDSGETVRLALELLRRIPRHRKISAKELHEQLPEGLSRDLRTVQRQLEALSETFDIERDDSSKPYGYRWKELGPTFTVPHLSEKESLLLALAQEQLRYLLPASLMRTMNGFFEQARRQLNASPKEKEWLGKVRVVSPTQPLLPPKVRPGVFEAVSQALYTNHWLRIDYQNAEKKRDKFDVMPLGLAQQGARLYLVCKFKDYADERSLALHRMFSADISAEEFRRPRDFDLKRYDEEGRLSHGSGRTIQIKFEIEKSAGRHLLESQLSTDQTADELEDKIVICASVTRSTRLVRWLKGFGSDINILEPDWLAWDIAGDAISINKRRSNRRTSTRSPVSA